MDNLDSRSSLIQSGDLLFTNDGSIDGRSAAVKSGEVSVNQDGTARANSVAINSGDLKLAPSMVDGASDRRDWRVGERDVIFEKAQPIAGMDSNHATDAYGNMIYKPNVGQDTQQGWTGDHGTALANQGTYHPNNLHPMQMAQNKSKGSMSTTEYGATNPEPMGITVPEYNAVHSSGVDQRSSDVRSGDLSFNNDGSVDGRSSAVRSGEVLKTKDGGVDGRSSAVKSGAVKLK
jgi:hypothetical protein